MVQTLGLSERFQANKTRRKHTHTCTQKRENVSTLYKYGYVLRTFSLTYSSEHIQRGKERGDRNGGGDFFLNFWVLLLFYTLYDFLSFSINQKFYRNFNPFSLRLSPPRDRPRGKSTVCVNV